MSRKYKQGQDPIELGQDLDYLCFREKILFFDRAHGSVHFQSYSGEYWLVLRYTAQTVAKDVTFNNIHKQNNYIHAIIIRFTSANCC